MIKVSYGKIPVTRARRTYCLYTHHVSSICIQVTDEVTNEVK